MDKPRYRLVIASALLFITSFCSAAWKFNPFTSKLDYYGDLGLYSTANGTFIRFDPANDGDWQFEISEASAALTIPLYQSKGYEIGTGWGVYFTGDSGSWDARLWLDFGLTDTMQFVLGSSCKNTFLLTNDYYKRFSWSDQTHPTLVGFSDTDPSTTGRGSHWLMQCDGDDFHIKTGTSTPNIKIDPLSDGTDVEITDSSVTFSVPIYGDGSNLTGTGGYSIVIGTTSRCDFICDGTADEVQFNQAFAAAGANGKIWVIPTNYYFTDCSSFTALGQQLLSDGAVIYYKPTVANLGSGCFYLPYDYNVLSGFIIDGTGASYTNRVIRITGDYWKVINCTVQNTVAHTNSVGFAPESGADYGLAENLQLLNIAGSYAMINYSSYNTYKNFMSGGTGSGWCDIRGTYCDFNGLNITGAVSYGLYPSGTGHVFTNFYIANSLSYAILDGGSSGCHYTNGVVYNMVDEGVSFGGNNTFIDNVTFGTIGGTGDNSDGITIAAGAKNCQITNCSFIGNIDRYPITVAATASNTVISNCPMMNITGNIGYILDSSTSTTILNCSPESIESKILNPTTFYQQVTAPTVKSSSITITGKFTFPVVDGTTGQVMVTNGGGTVSWDDLDGDVTGGLGNTVVADDSHAHVIGNIDQFTEAALEAKLSDASDIYTNLDGILISTAPVTNGATGQMPSCDDVYDFCETTQDYLKTSEYSPSGGAAALMVSVDEVETSSPTIAISFENVFTGLKSGNTTFIYISTATPANGDTTHIPNGDQIYDWGIATFQPTVTEGSLTDSVIVSADIKDATIATADLAAATSGYLTNWANVSNKAVVTGEITDATIGTADLSAACSGYLTNWMNFSNIPTDYAVTISSPNALAIGVGYLISPIRDYAYTISTATLKCVGGTNAIGMIEQRALNAEASAGTDVFSGDITATAVWVGGTIADGTVPANYGLFYVPTSASGDPSALMIRYKMRHD